MLNTQAWDGASYHVRSYGVGCAVAHTIAGKNCGCGDGGVRELEGEDIERRYGREAKTMHDYTGITLGAEKAHSVAAYARVVTVDLAGWVIGLTHPVYPRGLPTTAYMHRSTSTVSTSIRASW